MKQPEYRSVFSSFINDFIDYKRAGGYKYVKETAYLKQFDDYCCSQEVISPALTKELMDSWCKKRPYEAERNSHMQRVSCTKYPDYRKNSSVS